MNRSATSIRELREQLLIARRERRSEQIGEIVAGVRELGGRGYRCCLVDYEHFRTACYVRILGFENDRIKAQIEFPIRPGVQAVQHLPLSHLVDYEESTPGHLRDIYEGLGAYLKRRDAALMRRRPRPCGGPALRSALSQKRRPVPGVMSVWWGVAGVLFTSSLVLFIATT